AGEDGHVIVGIISDRSFRREGPRGDDWVQRNEVVARATERRARGAGDTDWELLSHLIRVTATGRQLQFRSRPETQLAEGRQGLNRQGTRLRRNDGRDVYDSP